MTGAAERLITVANDYRGLAAHYREQGYEPLAERCEMVELILRLVAQAMAADEQEDEAA